MNEDITRMAREAGAIPIHGEPKNKALVGLVNIERFAELVRADEREACAKVCDDFEIPKKIQGAHPDYLDGKEMAALQLAKAIRARNSK